MKHLVAPSILAADFARLGEEVKMLNDSSADWLHVDVMDGRFVPNISFGQVVVKALKGLSKKPLDVHLMIEEPERYVQSFRDAGASLITVHYEACRHLHRCVQMIKKSGAMPGVALNPHTPVSVLEDIIEEVALVCVMSVNPGFGGQPFIYQAVSKVRKLHEMIQVRNARAMIEVDGGVGLENAEALLQAGARVLVAGSSVFGAKNPVEAVSQMKAIGQDTLMV